MSLDNPRSSYGSAAEFQSSGLPWVTSSVSAVAPQRWSFAKVTRAVTITNTSLVVSESIGVGFSPEGVSGTNYYQLLAGQSERFELRIKDLYIQAKVGTPPYSVLAELTTVDRSQMPHLTGSLWDGV